LIPNAGSRRRRDVYFPAFCTICTSFFIEDSPLITLTPFPANGNIEVYCSQEGYARNERKQERTILPFAVRAIKPAF
jgi:hypothetical protein